MGRGTGAINGLDHWWVYWPDPEMRTILIIHRAKDAEYMYSIRVIGPVKKNHGVGRDMEEQVYDDQMRVFWVRWMERGRSSRSVQTAHPPNLNFDVRVFVLEKRTRWLTTNNSPTGSVFIACGAPSRPSRVRPPNLAVIATHPIRGLRMLRKTAVMPAQ